MNLKKLYFLVTFFSFFYAVSVGQYRIELKNESFTPERNISVSRIGELNKKLGSLHKKSFVVIQFEQIPTEDEKRQLKNEGVELLDYIPNNAYTAIVTNALNPTSLQKGKVRSVVELSAKQKMHPSLASGNFPSHAVKVAGMVDVWISFPKTFSFQEVSDELRNRNLTIIAETYQAYGVLELRIPSGRVAELATLPFIQYVQAIPKPDQAFNDQSVENSRANVLGSSVSGSRNLHGEGIVVGIGDNANPMLHIDFNNRIINRFASENSSAHGMHVMGTMGGAGIVDERYKGYVPKAKIIAHYFSNLISNLPNYVKDYGMVVTNNSYGNDVTSCSSFGVYDLFSQILDQQAFMLPYLQNVFAAGNSGTNSCSPFPAGFANILGGYQTAKNILTVGNTEINGQIAGGSSRGPVKDGRIKPEIVVQGTDVASTLPGDRYGEGTGTSMAAPAVAGSVGLLYQQYRKLHGGANPKNALVKALICNSGMDKGNAGPDFKYGFGWLNLVRAVKMMESGSYFNDAVSTNNSKTHTITVPENTAQLKVMLYWNDPAAAALANQTLVNDLDIEVTSPSSVKTLPKLLDAAPSNVDNPATTGVDHINNIEQVVIENPASGDYTVLIKGTAINQNPNQEYFVVYDAVPVETAIMYPIGNEHIQAGDVMNISWDSFGNDSKDFTVQYSADNGNVWNDINTAVPADARQLSWTVPSVISAKAKVRILKNGTDNVSTSEAFTIVGVPAISLSGIQCEGYIGIEWNAIEGATDYEVMILQGDEMVTVNTVSGTSYNFSGLSKDETYWVTVRARINGNPGRRGIAISRKPDNGNCAGNISNNDLKLDAIVSPASSGRKFTTTELSGANKITIRVKNLDDQNTAGEYKARYFIDNVLKAEEIVSTSISAGSTYDFTFAVSADFSAVKSYNLKVEIDKSEDLVKQNNSIEKTINQLNNSPVALPFVDDMESLPTQESYSKQTGLNGSDRYDFASNSPFGRIRTFTSSGGASSGEKALALDLDRFVSEGNVNYLIATFNLSTFNAPTDDIRVNFKYRNHGQASNANNRVWIRGKDSDEWIEVYNLFSNQNYAGGDYKLSSDIELSKILATNSKNFSASFQIRWGQFGKLMIADEYSGAGYSFDDIRMFQVSNDVQLVSLNNMMTSGCGIGNSEQVKITVRNNSANNLTNIPVKFQIDNGTVFSENILSLNGNSAVEYIFQARADLSSPGVHALKVWADLASDSNRSNDAVTTEIFNSPVITSFPYLEDFESGNGFWYSKGSNSTWAYGTPSSSKIKKAASGNKAWKTSLAGNYNVKEISYLYSPCFDLRGMLVPTISFNMAMEIEDCGTTICDMAYMEYSTDGMSWRRLGANGQGTNWYNKTNTNDNGWSFANYVRWHVATIPLPAGSASIRLRFVLRSDETEVREGVAIDDIHVYDNRNGIYEGSVASAAAQGAVGDMQWINYTNNGTLVASVLTNNQDMGNTDVRTYFNSGSIRNTNGQYYLNRNITIKPTNFTLSDSLTVRLYFLDSDVEKLINASGCSSCDKPSSITEIGISKYSDSNEGNEDGTVTNNSTTGWLFIPAANTKKVPFDKGYYAEIKVKNLSEFWLSKEAMGTTVPLPVKLVSFNAKLKSGTESTTDVITDWETSSEVDFSHFEVEVAKGNEALKLGQFTTIGEVFPDGNANKGRRYSFVDYENNKSDIRYYRLKMVDLDQSYSYSMVRSVVVNEKIEWLVFPNPSRDMFNISYQAKEGENVQINITDITGRSSLKRNILSNGSAQKLEINLGDATYPPGLYVVEVIAGKKREVFRLVKL